MGTGGIHGASGRMRVMDAVQGSIDRTRTMLFEPFDFERWLLFGILAFLDMFLAGGGLTRSSANVSGQNHGGGSQPPNFDQAVDWLSRYAVQITLIAVPLIVIVLAIHVGLLYLGCRGQLMFVRAVSQNGGKIGDHWSEVKVPAYSLFLFRLALLGIWLAFIAVLAVFLFAAIGIQGGIHSGEALFFTLVPFGIVVVLCGIALGIVQVMLRSFVVPLMWARALSCLEAWRIFLPVANNNLASLIGFLVIKIAYSIGFGIVSIFAGCLTCCIGLLPVVHHTLFAPYYVFDRVFTMELIAMTGEDDGVLFAALPVDETPPPQIQ